MIIDNSIDDFEDEEGQNNNDVNNKTIYDRNHW